MKWLSAGLTFVNFSTLFGLLMGMLGHGLTTPVAIVAFFFGAIVAVAAFIQTRDPEELETPSRGRSIWFWVVAVCFLVFALRSFCWLIYIDGDQLRIQSPNNLGDLALHITYIKNFANGVPIWPDNPIYVFSKLRYPAGIDIFNALLCSAHIDLIRGLVWVGLLASLATFYAFWRWGGAFGIAGFLFNGGLAGFQAYQHFKFTDFQDVGTIAWKSIPLTMFVTQRGLLYAIPAGLLLLWHWRNKFWPADTLAGGVDAGPSSAQATAVGSRSYRLPFWLELSLYATMPLFHFHTFLALSLVLFLLFVIEASTWVFDFVRRSLKGQVPATLLADALSRMPNSKHVLLLVGAAIVPATFFVWLITDHFHAGSAVGWQAGWVQALKGDDLAKDFIPFWFVNFGLWLPVVLTFVGLIAWRAWTLNHAPFILFSMAVLGLCIWRMSANGFHWSAIVFLTLALAFLIFCFTQITTEEDKTLGSFPGDVFFVLAATIIFLSGYLFKLAPWGWDNLKVMIWGYFIILPFIWRGLILLWPVTVRYVVCIALFGSGFATLIAGLGAGTPGFGFANRVELDAVGNAVRLLPVDARFAAFPTYNHPLLLQGRKLVLGYPGHLWTQGFADYAVTEKQLKQVMLGAQNWRETAKKLGIRYIYWGREEESNYPMSTRPWQGTALRVTSGRDWGSIYDLEAGKFIDGLVR